MVDDGVARPKQLTNVARFANIGDARLEIACLNLLADRESAADVYCGTSFGNSEKTRRGECCHNTRSNNDC